MHRSSAWRPGIGTNAAIFSAVHQVLLRPLPFAAPEMAQMAVPHFNYLDFEAAATDSLAGIAAMGLQP